MKTTSSSSSFSTYNRSIRKIINRNEDYWLHDDKHEYKLFEIKMSNKTKWNKTKW
jgi:hypothetical protein